MIPFIDDCIAKALRGEHILTPAVFNIKGFSTPTMRILFSHLCRIKGTYLEVGLYCGATFVSSFNPDLTSIGIENYSQSFDYDKVKEELEENVSSINSKAKKTNLYFEDAFQIDKSKMPDDINIFFYDGEHSEESQSKALPFFIDKMAKQFIFIVDDINWDSVAMGTTKGFEALEGKIIIENAWVCRGTVEQDDPIWHNGLGIFLINKI